MNDNTIEQLKTLIDAAGNPVGIDVTREAESGLLLGSVFFYSLTKGANYRNLIQSCSANYIDPDNIPEMPSEENSFKWAVRQSTVYVGENRCEIISKASDKSKVVASVMQRHEDENENRVDYYQRSRVAICLTDSNGDRLINPYVVKEVSTDPVANRIEQLYQWNRQCLTADQLAPLCKNVLLECNRVRLRKRGGVYFVAAEKHGILEALVRVLNDVGCEGYIVPIFRTAAAEGALQKLLEEETNDEVASLFEELEAFEKKLDAGGKGIVRTSTLESRLDELEELRGKVLMFSRLPRKDSEQLLSLFDQAEDKIHNVITRRQEHDGNEQ